MKNLSLNIISYFRNSTFSKTLLLILLDVVLISCSYAFSFWLRLDVALPYPHWDDWSHLFFQSLPLLLIIRFGVNWLSGLYTWSFSHVGLFEASRLVISTLLASILFILINYCFTPFYTTIPRSIYVLEGTLTFILLSLIRFLPKYLNVTYCHYYKQLFTSAQSLSKTIIYGAGGNAELLMRELVRTTNHQYKLVGFIDDSPMKKNISLYGLKVLGTINDLPSLIKKFGVTEILITIPAFSGEPLRNLIDICTPFNIGYKVVPEYKCMLTRAANVTNMMERIKPDALIDRVQVAFNKEDLISLYKNKTILVTGGVGSIGSEICRQLADCGASRLIILDMNENDGYFLQSDLLNQYSNLDLFFEIGSIQDRELISKIMKKYTPDIVFHAAAHKHVPLMEKCPLEAIKNNVLGTLIVIEEAQKHGVDKFLLISSDKAVAPTNIMGATKSIAERVMRSTKAKGSMECRSVRFGNVLGSNGSLLQIIQRQILKGGPVTITHPEMTRYFMTIPEAVGLVLATMNLSESDTFVLDMGKPISIDKLVRQIVSLSGLVSGRDIDIIYTQRRPGEKMYEEIFSPTEKIEDTTQERIFAVLNEEKLLDTDLLEKKIRCLSDQEEVESINFLLEYAIDYNPIEKNATTNPLIKNSA